jgi:putative ABC transport system permease protein
MANTTKEEVTRLLSAAEQGERAALDALFSLLYDELRNVSLAETDGAYFYRALRLEPAAEDAGQLAINWTLIVRSSAGAESLAGPAVLRIFRALDPNVLVTAESLEERLRNRLQPGRIAGLLAGMLGALATLLAVIGVYGPIAYSVSQRTREIGVRLVLGASPGDIRQLVLRQGAVPLVFGLLLGLPVAAVLAQLARNLLFGLHPLDPIAFGGMAVLLAVVALIAMHRPAHRAAHLDPASTLRQD